MLAHGSRNQKLQSADSERDLYYKSAGRVSDLCTKRPVQLACTIMHALAMHGCLAAHTWDLQSLSQSECAHFFDALQALHQCCEPDSHPDSICPASMSLRHCPPHSDVACASMHAGTLELDVVWERLSAADVAADEPAFLQPSEASSWSLHVLDPSQEDDEPRGFLQVGSAYPAA